MDARTHRPGNANLPIGSPGKPERSVRHREHWHRYTRNERHFRQTVQYIHENPVTIGWAAKAEDWRWSSAFAEHANQEIGPPGTKP
jgi:hypothetical protein